MSEPTPPPAHSQKSELAKFIAGFGFAFSGLWYALRTQRNVRVHVAIAILAILLGILLHISTIEFAIIFVAITGVFIAGMFNQVFELGFDLASPDFHPLAKVATAGAVLVSGMLGIVIGLFVFGLYLWELIRR